MSGLRPNGLDFTSPKAQHLLLHLAFSLALLPASLAAGMCDGSYFEHLPWREACLNTAMIRGGMGSVKQDWSEPGKVFAGLFELYSGLVVIAVTALLLAPGIHHIMK